MKSVCVACDQHNNKIPPLKALLLEVTPGGRHPHVIFTFYSSLFTLFFFSTAHNMGEFKSGGQRNEKYDKLTAASLSRPPVNQHFETVPVTSQSPVTSVPRCTLSFLAVQLGLGTHTETFNAELPRRIGRKPSSPLGSVQVPICSGA